jgi:LacI family transcriptional regulator
MVTIKDIAKRLDVSPSTVSKGLNDANDVSPELKKLVLDTAIEMGYVTKRMKKGKRKKLAIFIENMEYQKEDDFGFDIILGFKQAALREDWDVVIINTDIMLQLGENYDRYMLKNNYHGGFFMGFALNDPWIKQLAVTTIPTVLLDNYIKGNPVVGYVGTDSFEGIDLAVEHLYSLGHTKIALLNGSPDSMVTENRYDAYITSMKAHGLEIDENLIEYGYYVEGSAKYHIKKLIENGATAVICGNDLLAVGVLKECDKMGVMIPKDLSVVGYDNLPVSKQVSLTTIKQDRLNLGRCSYAALYWLIAKVPIAKSLLRPELVHRTTTGKIETSEQEDD